MIELRKCFSNFMVSISCYNTMQYNTNTLFGIKHYTMLSSLQHSNKQVKNTFTEKHYKLLCKSLKKKNLLKNAQVKEMSIT